MLKIGDFSKLSRISIRMLRHYDEIGLLKPEMVDEMTQYRYYSEAQLPIAGRIQTLKSLGFRLTAIDEILKKYEEPEELEQFLLIKRKELEEDLQQTKEKLLLLDNTLKWLRKEGNFMDYNVTLKTMPKRYVASLRQVIPSYECEGMLWELMCKELEGQKVQQANPSYGLAIFHDEGYKESDTDVEIQISVEGKYEDTEHVKFKTVPSLQIASTTYQGSYEQLPKVHENVAKWVRDNGYTFHGDTFCIYHVSPAQTSNPDELVTEVCYPVQKNA